MVDWYLGCRGAGRHGRDGGGGGVVVDMVVDDAAEVVVDVVVDGVEVAVEVVVYRYVVVEGCGGGCGKVGNERIVSLLVMRPCSQA
jgi:hypothetical protein